MKKFIGLIICLFIILGAVIQVGPSFYNDISSFLFVVGGGFGYSILKNNEESFIKNFGEGAIYFGWLGTLIGLIALTGGKGNNWGDIEKMGPALSVLMLTLFYAYTIKLITLVFGKNNS